MLTCSKTFKVETIVDEVLSVSFFKDYVNFLVVSSKQIFLLTK